MKTLPLLAAATILGGSIHSYAQAPAEPAKTEEAAKPAKRSLLKYSAPKGAAPGGRIDGDGGSRGTADKDQLPSLKILAPNHTALTTQASPSLFWYQAGGADKPFELTLTEPKNPKPVLKLSSPKSEKAGVRRISLSRQNVTLKAGVEYKWSVSWVPDANNRSLNVMAQGTIKYVEPDAKVAAAVSDKKGVELAEAYAQNGIWYDALEAISNAMEADPQNKDLRATRADLLEQAGLKDAATAERK